jgi:hypothetical protein
MEQIFVTLQWYQSLLELHVHSDAVSDLFRDRAKQISYQSLLELHVHSDKETR